MKQIMCQLFNGKPICWNVTASVFIIKLNLDKS